MRALRPYLFLSLLLHLLFLFFFKIPDRTAFKTLALSEPIWVDLKRGQYEIVDILPPVKEERPEETKFLGMYDSRVNEEMVSEREIRSREDQKSKIKNQKDRSKFKEDGKDTLASFNKAMALAYPEDFHPDFHRGAHTYLNVLRFPDVQYFVRLKRVFKMTFNPVPPLQDAYFHNRITTGRLETVVGVSVDPKGNLEELFVLKGSGIEQYDEEALRTIRASAPFSAPPAKFLDQEGLLRMSWTFTVYL